MEKIVIDLTNNQLTEATVHRVLPITFKKCSHGDSQWQALISQPPFAERSKQIDSFFRALKGEKRYMDAYAKYGLGRLANHDE